jgi:hypothetical protein
LQAGPAGVLLFVLIAILRGQLSPPSTTEALRQRAERAETGEDQMRGLIADLTKAVERNTDAINRGGR